MIPLSVKIADIFMRLVCVGQILGYRYTMCQEGQILISCAILCESPFLLKHNLYSSIQFYYIFLRYDEVFNLNWHITEIHLQFIFEFCFDIIDSFCCS